MDFKVTGTKNGVTALQMDIKIGWITSALMREALAQQKPVGCISGAYGTGVDYARRSSAFAPRIPVEIKQDKFVTSSVRAANDPQHHRGDRREITLKTQGMSRSLLPTRFGAEGHRHDQALTEEVEVGKIYLGRFGRS